MAQEPPDAGRGRRSRKSPTIWGNIPPRNPNFTGREELLTQLHHHLLQEGTAAVLPHTLHGMGGVGKTTLAVEYIYQRQHEYDVVWWIPAERTAQISQSLAELALRLGIDFNGGAPDVNSIVVAVLESLRTGVPYVDWLLVFDNAESPDAVSQFLPASGTGNVLITSRNPQWAALARPLEVDVFQREESKSLLKVRGREIDDENADRLAEALGDLPMAIEQAAAWHAETGMRVEEYLRLLDEKQIDLLQGTAPTDGGHPAIAAWNISLDELESRNPAAYQLLQVCSCYAPEPISRSLFTPRSCEAISPELDAVLGDPIRLGQAIREVGRYSLARFHHHANSLQMHRLVRAALQLRMTEDDQAVIRRGAHLLLAASDPNDPGNTACWPRYAKLYPHVIVSGAVSSAESQVRGLVVNETIYLLRWGDYETGHDLAHTAHEAWARTLGMDHPHTLQIARWQGFLLFSLGRYQEAAELNANVLEAYRRSAGPEHQDTVDALGNVALDHRVRGDFTEALRLSDSVHQKYLRLLGPDDPETLRAAYNLAVSLRLTGDFAQARLLDEQTWRSYTLVYGHNRVESLRTWFGLALDMRELGEYSAALIRHREIYEQAIELVGRDNPLTLSVLRYLSVALRQAGLHAEALSTAERAHADLVRRYGPHHPESLAASMELSVNLREAGQAGEALALGTKCWRQLSNLYGPDHPHPLAAAVSLANAHRARGNAAAAQRICAAALRQQTAVLGADHPSTLMCMVNLASCHHALDDPHAALQLSSVALEGLRRSLSEDHPLTLMCAMNLAVDLLALGRADEADALRSTSAERLGSRMGGGHPIVLAARDTEHRVTIDISPMPL
ncbi:FxSxx-COOH system tetratricopeptide repeat protein [Streptomyces pseudovenezuelae]|uniref:FxSxx-COOH system tetratricopeptide repeat protein n=2 Tax=Streptomyces pseudovenezuelae TaxID=67350 RepID=UPI0034A23F7C